MHPAGPPELDLMPPAFAEGLDDWSRGDGTPDSPTWETAAHGRLVRDTDFGICLEMRMVEAVQWLRYMGEVPVRRDAFLAIATRVKALSGPLPAVRVAAWPGGAHGRGVPGLATTGPELHLAGHGVAVALRAVIGPEARPGVGIVWDGPVRYAHVGIDVLGAEGGVVRIESLQVVEVTRQFRDRDRPLPGFGPEAADAR